MKNSKIIKKKTTIFVLVASILLVSLGVAYAYWSAVIQSEGASMSFEAMSELKIIYTEGSNVTGEGVIKPGWRYTKTFAVENESSGPFKFNIVIKNLENTFVTDFLKYKITSTDGYNMTEYESIPKSSTPKDTVLSYNIEISGKSTQHYTVEFYYENSAEVDQSEDIGKKFGGSLGVKEGPKELYHILTDGRKYRVDSTRNTNTDTPLEGTTLIEGYNSTRKIYMTNKTSETEDGTTKNPIYYFAGNPSDNWVKFAGFYWRIIRTDKDHGIRLLYAGTTPDTTQGYIKNGKWGSSYTDINGIKYENAKFKKDLEDWYEENIGSKYSSLISTTATYCNDTSYTENVDKKNKVYGAYTRLKINKTPSYKCPNKSDNLKIKAGLMTADEVAFAGGVNGIISPNTYFYRNSANGSVTGDLLCLTFSPFYVSSNNYVFISLMSSTITYINVNQSEAIRPVITLSPEVLVKDGVGTDTDPFTILGTED